MRKTILLICCFALFLGGCKYFRKSSSKMIDTITADTTSTDDVIDSAAYYSNMSDVAEPGYAEDAVPDPSVIQTQSVSGNYYMIVGCFTVPANADRYVKKLRGMGYNPQIIPGRGNFQMVAARSYNSYRESVSEIDQFRNEVTPNAWVYRQR